MEKNKMKKENKKWQYQQHLLFAAYKFAERNLDTHRKKRITFFLFVCLYRPPCVRKERTK